jgi:hypothetical protein
MLWRGYLAKGIISSLLSLSYQVSLARSFLGAATTRPHRTFKTTTLCREGASATMSSSAEATTTTMTTAYEQLLTELDAVKQLSRVSAVLNYDKVCAEYDSQ